MTFADIARMSVDTLRDTALVSINTIMVLRHGAPLTPVLGLQAEVSNERRSLMKRHLCGFNLSFQCYHFECTAVSNSVKQASNNTDTRKVSLNTRRPIYSRGVHSPHDWLYAPT